MESGGKSTWNFSEHKMLLQFKLY